MPPQQIKIKENFLHNQIDKCGWKQMGTKLTDSMTFIQTFSLDFDCLFSTVDLRSFSFCYSGVIVLVISNQPHPFEIACPITPWIVLHSVLLPLLVIILYTVFLCHHEPFNKEERSKILLCRPAALQFKPNSLMAIPHLLLNTQKAINFVWAKFLNIQKWKMVLKA